MTTGGGPGICYRLTVRSGAGFTYGAANVSGNGFAGIQTATYPADADITFKIEKTCDTTVRENVTYTVDFHL